jgi:hypothetical protein
LRKKTSARDSEGNHQTDNPCDAHGADHAIGPLQFGKDFDLVRRTSRPMAGP